MADARQHYTRILQTFAEEMQKYLDVLDELKHASERKTRSWDWMRWWKRGRDRKFMELPYNSEERESLIKQQVSPIKPIKKTAIPRGIPDAMINRRDTYSWEAAPEASKVVATVSQRLLRLLRKLARDDSKWLYSPTIFTSAVGLLNFEV